MPLMRTMIAKAAQSRTRTVVIASSLAKPASPSFKTNGRRPSSALVGGEKPRAVERAHLGGHQALRSRTETGQHAVARLGVDEAVAAQRLHVDENVFGALAPGEKPEPARPVEPLDDDDLEPTDRRRLSARARGGERRGIARFGLADGDHLEHLKAALALRGFGDDPRPFADRGETVPSQHGDMDQDIRLAAVGHDKSVTFDGVEPFDASSDFDETRGGFVRQFAASRRLQRLREILAQFGPLLNAS